MQTPALSPNQLAFIALANEYCRDVERVAEFDRADFIDKMLRLLPRLYMAATDLPEVADDDDFYSDQSLDEDGYETVRSTIADLMGEDDTYLEVFEEEMKYSDTPIAASISEGLADIFQALYNFIESVRNAPDDLVVAALASIREDFGEYWSQPLCNSLRALNHVKYKA